MIGVDNKDVLETAMRLHAIDVAADDPVVLAEADLVILAAPVRQNIELLAELDEHVRQPAVVTDTGSTKRAVVDAARGLPPKFTFIGGHPLGGAAKGGLENARPDLFEGRPWLLTPSGDGGGDAVEKLSAFVTALGAVPRVVDVATHDRLLAYLSHLPQLTASALMQVVGRRRGARRAGARRPRARRHDAAGVEPAGNLARHRGDQRRRDRPGARRADRDASGSAPRSSRRETGWPTSLAARRSGAAR